MADKNRFSLFENLLLKIEELKWSLDKANIAEYIELYRKPKRLFYLNFFAGIFRGFGIALGFTVVGAFFLYVLGKVASLNLPLVGEFIAEITRIVQNELSGRP